jgi:hypothetical protein
MEIEDNFEEWDCLDVEELEMLFSEDEKEKDEKEKDEKEKDDDESDDESESENEETDELKCSKCSKIYHVVGWLKKHEVSCDGKTKKSKSTNNKKGMSQHQKHVREILSSLGFDDYYNEMCVPAILSALQEVCGVEEATVKLRGSRFAICKIQAHIILVKLKENSPEVDLFFKNISQKLWTICFARDRLLSSSRRHQYVAQHLNEFRQSQNLSSTWIELNKMISTNHNDKLLLQSLIRIIFGDICLFRTQSLGKALEIKEQYSGETPNKPSLTPVEKDIVAYVAGYVCRKVRDRLQRYCHTNGQSKISKVQEKCVTLGLIVKVISTMVPGGVEKQAPAMSFPNLMTLSLTRGGLTQVDHATFNFFCYLEVSVRPFLNLANFRSSNRKSDSEVLDQLIENSSLLKPAWPYSSSLPAEASNLLLKHFYDLYFRVGNGHISKFTRNRRNSRKLLLF